MEIDDRDFYVDLERWVVTHRYRINRWRIFEITDGNPKIVVELLPFSAMQAIRFQALAVDEMTRDGDVSLSELP